MRGAKYIFGGLAFTSKSAVAAHARELRARYARRETITAPTDIAFLSELFACNVEAHEKRGNGIKRFYWAKAPQHPTECFWIERMDGLETEFGVPACLDEIGRLNRAALRAAVSSDIDAFRRTKLASGSPHTVSEFSGKSFPTEEMEADHITPFAEIVRTFFEPLGIDVGNYMLTQAVDAQSEPVWRDPQRIEAFRVFHARFPLRIVHRSENQGVIRREWNRYRASGG